jgi:cellulose synthase/poly-beta-1,6-N-acetylglucosamine synthase-like glycosyltransferase
MALVISIIYGVSLLYIFLYSLSQLHLTWIYLSAKKVKNQPPPALKEFPVVTIQLPIYNEKYVVERLLESVSQLDYPKGRIEVQVLDDSTDETTKIIIHKLEELKLSGWDVQHIHRNSRVGFKAGALAHGLTLAKGEFIAIFDADFTPSSDFLKLTLPYFEDKSIGVVQTRWGHGNRDYSLLTRLQAFGLDAHFSIEQSARNAAGSFINFNGTCGVWRTVCIKEAGGWSADTLTEDLDLSYRAQLKGWKFKYVQQIETPGELPVIMPAIKSQQYRWNKGGAETARKIFGEVLRSSLPLKNKIHAFFHLFNSSVFVALLVAALLSVPMLYIKQQYPQAAGLFNLGIVFIIGFLSIAIFYWVSVRQFYPMHTWKKFLALFPGFLIVSMGLAWHNGVAVLEGLIGRKTPFIRTPKFNLPENKTWLENSYVKIPFKPEMVIEGLLFLYFIFGIWLGWHWRDGALIFFHVLLAAGFGCVFLFSVKPVFHVKK